MFCFALTYFTFSIHFTRLYTTPLFPSPLHSSPLFYSLLSFLCFPSLLSSLFSSLSFPPLFSPLLSSHVLSLHFPFPSLPFPSLLFPFLPFPSLLFPSLFRCIFSFLLNIAYLCYIIVPFPVEEVRGERTPIRTYRSVQIEDYHKNMKTFRVCHKRFSLVLNAFSLSLKLFFLHFFSATFHVWFSRKNRPIFVFFYAINVSSLP